MMRTTLDKTTSSNRGHKKRLKHIIPGCRTLTHSYNLLMRSSILDYRRARWPIDWHEAFGRHALLLVEIGFGDGEFLLDLARSRPACNVLGLEISAPSLRKAERKIERMALRNVRLVDATGQEALWALCSPGELDQVYINFPDPWPKAAHEHRRLINDRLLQLLASRMPTGGRLDIASDHAGYVTWIADCLARSPYFESRNGVPYVDRDPRRIQTKYEAKAVAAGRSCAYFKWERNARALANNFDVPEETHMPHVVIRGNLALEQLQAAFTQFECSRDTLHVRFMDLYLSRQHPAAVVEVYLAEEPMEQRLLLGLRRRKSGEWMLYVSDVGFPRASPGVHFAVQCLQRWLFAVGDGLEIVHHNLPSSEL
jgi:tRNA (guanine-N7-)-methyltransferase